MSTDVSNVIDQLSRSFAAVGEVIGKIGPEQWTAPTPCADWTVAQLVGHLVGMNRVFTAMLADQPPLRRDGGVLDDQLERLTGNRLLRCMPPSADLESSTAPTAVPSARRRAPSDCRSAWITCWLTAGTLPAQPGT